MRNKFEKTVANALPQGFAYEAVRLQYQLPVSRYIPDWYDAERGIIVEAKGRLRASDRAKMVAVRKAYPSARIIFVFQRPDARADGLKAMTNRDWAMKHGFEVLTLAELATL